MKALRGGGASEVSPTFRVPAVLVIVVVVVVPKAASSRLPALSTV
jgi:hypothetical protein